MTLGQAQERFAELLPRLLDEAPRLGFRVRVGEVYRPPQQAAYYASTGAGVTKSAHEWKLAVDLLLFRDGTYLKKTEDYAALGAFWTGLDPLCRWGGNFSGRKDGNHFSYTWGGRA